MRASAWFRLGVALVAATLALAYMVSGGLVRPDPDSAEVAVSTAREFCTRIGASVAPGVEATILSPDRNWPGATRVAFGHQVRVEIDPQTRRVLGFVDRRVEPSPSGPLGKQEAVELSADYLEAAGGLPGPAVVAEAKFVQLFDDTAQWWVFWRRKVGAYPDSVDGANLGIAPDTGRLIWMGIRWYSGSPASLDVNVTREQAIDLARKYAAASDPLREAKLMIAHPELYDGMVTEASETETNLKSVLAWYVYFDSQVLSHVVVSAADGALVGKIMYKGSVVTRGTGAGTGPKAQTGHSVRDLFHRAFKIELVTYDRTTHARRVAATIRKQSDASRVARLASLVGADCDFRWKLAALDQLRVTGADGRTMTFDYFPEQRVLRATSASEKMSATVEPAFDAVLRGGAR